MDNGRENTGTVNSGENSPVKEECVYKCEVTKVVEGEKKI